MAEFLWETRDGMREARSLYNSGMDLVTHLPL